MPKILNADDVAKRVETAGQAVVGALPKPPQGPTAAEQIAAQQPFTVTLNKPNTSK
jgi:hypothetical protein